MILKRNNNLLIKCECSTHAFEIEVDEDRQYNISLWSMMCDEYPFSWKERMRWAWNIIRTGKPWTDSIILNEESTNEIVSFINQHNKHKNG